MTYLVDIPGFAEAGPSNIATVAESALRGGTAYLLMMPYFQLRNCGDVSILEQLKRVDPGIRCNVFYIVYGLIKLIDPFSALHNWVKNELWL